MRTRAALLPAVLIMVLAGCGDGSGPSDPAGTTPPPTGQSGATTGSSSGTPPDPPPITARVTTGRKPCGVLGAAGKVWVSNYGDGTLVAIDPVTTRPGVPIVVGSQPCGLAFGDGSIWVENYGSDDVTRVDAVTGEVLATIEVGNQPYDVTFADGAAWVTDYADGSVSRIDAGTNERTVVDTGGRPTGIARTPGAVWVPLGTDQVVRIDTSTSEVVATITTAAGASWTAYDETSVWVSNGLAGTVSRIDPATDSVVATVAVGPKPLDGDVVDGVVWVPDRDGRIFPIDVATNEVGEPLDSSAANPFVIAGLEGVVWAVDFLGTDVVRIDPATLGS